MHTTTRMGHENMPTKTYTKKITNCMAAFIRDVQTRQTHRSEADGWLPGRVGGMRGTVANCVRLWGVLLR